MPIGQAARLAAAEAACSVVPPSGEDLITLDLVDVPAQQVFEAIGDQVGKVPVFKDGVVTFEKDSGFDRFYVMRTGYDEALDVVEVLKMVVGGDGEIRELGDRIAVAGTESAIKKAQEVERQLTGGPDAWLLEIRVVQITESFRESLGISWSVGGEASVGVDAGVGYVEGAIPVLGAAARAAVSAIAEASRSGSDAKLVTLATLFLLEGKQASLQQGDVVPVPRRQVTELGAVQTVGYEQVQTGFTVTATGRRVPGGLQLLINPKVSSVSGFVEEVPITTERSVTVEAIVASGDWLVLSGFEQRRAFSEATGTPGLPDSLLTSSKDESTEADSMLVLVRATRVFAAGNGG